MMRPLGGVERRLMRGLIGFLSVWQWRLYRWQGWAEQRATTMPPPVQDPAQGGAMPPPEAPQDGGPPAHWAALVRRRAPWLLSRPPHPREVAPIISAIESRRAPEVRDAPVSPRGVPAPRQPNAAPSVEPRAPEAPRALDGVSIPGGAPMALAGEKRETTDMPPPDGTRHTDASVSARPRVGRVSVARETPARNQTLRTSANTSASLLSEVVAEGERGMSLATSVSTDATPGTEECRAETGRHEARPVRSAAVKSGRFSGPHHRHEDTRHASLGLMASADPGHHHGVATRVNHDPVAGVVPRRAPPQRPDVRPDEREAAPFPLPRDTSPRTHRPAEVRDSTTATWPSLPDEGNESAESNRWPDLPPAVSPGARSRERAPDHAARLRREQEGRGWNA